MTDATDQNQERSPEAKLEEKRRRAAAARELLGRLAERYPACFTRDREKIRPLAIGILQKLRAELNEDPELKDTPGWMLRQALGVYTRSVDYLAALVEKRPRINLDGSEAGEVTEQEQQHARTQLDEILARRKARRPQKPRAGKRRPQQKRESDEERTRRKLEQLAAKFSRH